MKNKTLLASFLAVAMISFALMLACEQEKKQVAEMTSADQIKYGEYLVNLAGCNDCHSPKIFTAQGPMPDTTRLLSGHPSDAPIPEIPPGVIAPEKWGALGSIDFTAWAGPWGVSFATNLTPDALTGMRTWDEASFIAAMRTGKHRGTGRDILPPMPWFNFMKLKDADLRAILAYLRSLKPVENKVPAPIPPGN